MGKKQILDEIINKPKPLSDEQKQAVISEKNYIRVIAGAGAGKTETLTRRVVYLLLCEEVEPRSIVAFTFTEKAAQSMKSRIYERVRQLRGEPACARLGEMYVGTIHAYCFRLLEDYFGYGGYDVLDENQEMAFLMREGWGLGLGVGGSYASNCRDFLRSANVVYDELIDRGELSERAPPFERHLETYESLLAQHRLLTFGTMIGLAVHNLQHDLGKVSHVKHLLVDEYQDINRAQEKLIKLIGQGASVFIVGDPRQSIYQWRGSDEQCFDDFCEHFKDVDSVVIKENRRSVRGVVSLANTFADTFERMQYEHLNATRDEEGLVTRVEHETPEDEASWIVSQIERYVDTNVCTYGDCALLLRSVATSADPFVRLLRDRNVPYLVGGKVGLFRRDEAQAVGRLCSWLWDEGFWVENPWRWWDQTAGDDLLETGTEKWSRATAIRVAPTKKRRLIEWKDKVLDGQFRNFTNMYHEVLLILDFEQLDPNDRLHAPIMANLGRFSSLLADYESSIRLGGGGRDWTRAVKGLCWYMNTYASGAYEEQLPEDIRGIDAVQITTVHQAKGLEWPIVYIPALVKRRFPSSKIGTEQNWFVPRDMFDVDRYEGEQDDERRLFYVALTRAKDVLCLSSFKRMKNRRARSSFVEPIADMLAAVPATKELPPYEISPIAFDDEIQTFSAAEIITYLKCPQFYRLREIWQYKPGLVDALGYGKSLHHCLRYASELMDAGIGPTEAIEKAVDEEFHVPYAGQKARETMKNRAREVLTRFVREHEHDMLKMKEVEARVEFPVQRATITGRVDVILKDDNSIEVRDYKTSDEVTTVEQASLQIRLYALGLQMIGMPVTHASLAYLEDAEVRDIGVERGHLEAARQIAETCIEGIGNARFDPEPHYCEHCDQRAICRWQETA